MKLEEVMAMIYGEGRSIGITHKQQDILGLPRGYPTGWYKQVKDMELTPEQVELFIDATTDENKRRMGIPVDEKKKGKKQKKKKRTNNFPTEKKKVKEARIREEITQTKIKMKLDNVLDSTQVKKLLSKASGYRDYKYIISNEFLQSQEWATLRYLAITSSSGVCKCCGRGRKDGIVLNVDHIKPRKLYPELALTLTNLQVLCDECNRGKLNFDITKHD